MNTLDDTVLHRIRRQLSHKRERAILPRPQRPIVTFGFDDCPLSAVENALPLLEAEDWRATIYVCVGLCGTTNHLGLHMREQDITSAHARGHEIADHTFSHINAKVRQSEDYLADIQKNQAALTALGLPPSRHFAYPFGDVTTPIKAHLRRCFSTLRGVLPPTSPDQDANFLPAMALYSGATIEAAIDRIGKLDEEPIWLNLFTHDVRENPSAYGCIPADFSRVVEAVKRSGATVLTTDQAYRSLTRESVAA